MGLSTADEYRASLRDGRTLWYRGRRVPDILDEPDLRVAVDHAALDYEVGHDPLYRDLAVAKDPDTGERVQRLLHDPPLGGRPAGALAADRDGHRPRRHDGHAGEGDRLRRAVRPAPGARGRGAASGPAPTTSTAATDDLAVAVAQTDVKGDRSLPPHAQADPDLYVHVVEERADGIVVRGAKCHTSISANAHEIIVLPTRAMGPDDTDYAVSFAAPVDTPGLSLYVSAYGARDHDAFEFPISSKHKMLETLTVFDDVFVPWERVFLCRQPELAGTVSHRVRRVPPLHRGVVQAPAARRPRRHRGADRGDERRGHGRPHPGEAHPARSSTPRRCAPSPRWRACGPRSASTASRIPTRSPPTWPSTPSPPATTRRWSWCRTARAACS